MDYSKVSGQVLSGIVAASRARDAAQDACEQELSASFPQDVRQLYDVWRADTGASDIAGQIIKAAHAKMGTIDVFELGKLDHDNLAASLRIMHVCAMPGLLSDRGLTVAPDGTQLLTERQVQDLLRDTHVSELML